MKNDYIDRLQLNMVKEGYNLSYVEKCCSYANSLISKNLPVIFDNNHLNIILNLSSINQKGYHKFEIKSNSKSREILAPSKELKERQRWILREILNKQPTLQCCHGFISQRSIKTNAEMHINKTYVLCMDIKDFFPSININKVIEVFREIGYTPQVSYSLAQLCTYNDILPQGAPTSPSLANIIFGPIDQIILDYISTKNIIYTRYADDLFFSSNQDISFLIPLINDIVKKHGFNINKSKTNLMKDPCRKKITGLIVTDTVKVPKYYKRKYNQELYYCERYGVAFHLNNCKSSKKINFREYMYGKAYYIKMIEPALGEKYLQRLDNINW